MVADGLVTRNELVLLDSLRAQLGISDKDHQKIIGELSAEERQLFDPAYQGSVEQRLAKQQYRKDLERLVVEAARAGQRAAPTTLAALRTERGVERGRGGATRSRRSSRPAGRSRRSTTRSSQQIARARGGRRGRARRAATATRANRRASRCSATSRVRRAHEHVVHALGVLAVMTKRPRSSRCARRAKRAARSSRRCSTSLARRRAALREPLRRAASTRLARGDHAPLAAAPILAVAGDARATCARRRRCCCRGSRTSARARALLALIDDPEAIVREAAVRAMGAKSRLTRELLAKVLDDPDARVRHAAVRAVSGGTSSAELPAIDPAVLAQTTQGRRQARRVRDARRERRDGVADDDREDDADPPGADLRGARRRRSRGARGDRRGAPHRRRQGPVPRGRSRRRGVPDREGRGARVRRRRRSPGDARSTSSAPGACIGEMAVLDSSPRSATRARARAHARAARPRRRLQARDVASAPRCREAIVAELVRRMRGMMAQQQGIPQASMVAIPLPPRE